MDPKHVLKTRISKQKGDLVVKEPLIAVALSKRALKCAEVLVKSGASVNDFGTSGGQYFTTVRSVPLHGAVEDGHLEMITFLLGHGADVNAVKEGQVTKETAIHMAILSNRMDVVELLLIPSIDLSIPRSHYGKTTGTMELITAPEMREVFGRKWSPEMNRSFPDAVRRVVRTILLCNRRWGLPRDLLFVIVRKVISQWSVAPPVKKKWPTVVTTSNK